MFLEVKHCARHKDMIRNTDGSWSHTILILGNITENMSNNTKSQKALCIMLNIIKQKQERLR